jgi:hypothetical protein
MSEWIRKLRVSIKRLSLIIRVCFHPKFILVSTPEENFASQSTLKSTTKSATTTNGLVPNRSTGRPCEICGFEPKTKNKSRERQDHLAMKHYRERIQADLATTDSYRCPLCEYNGKDKQTIYRHYTGKHKVQYLSSGYLSFSKGCSHFVSCHFRSLNNT